MKVKFISITAVFLVLIGCGSSPSSVLPPVELAPLTNQINISRQWKFTAGEGVSDFYLKLKPVFNHNTGYIVDYKGLLQAFVISSGKLLWETNLNVPVSGGLTLIGKNYFRNKQRGSYCLRCEKYKGIMASATK